MFGYTNTLAKFYHQQTLRVRAAEASESLDKRPGASPGANTEAAAWIDMQLMWPGTINPLIVINVGGRDYASAEVSDD